MLTLEDVLKHSNIDAKFDSSPNGITVVVTDATPEVASYIIELATNVFDYATDNSIEVASIGVIHLVPHTAPHYHDTLIRNQELADANEDTEDEMEEEDEEEEILDEDEDNDDGADTDAIVVPKNKNSIEDIEDRDLRVLVGPEHHKMVAKIYTGLCNNSDMAKYPAFTIDFDQFLRRYFIKPPIDHGFDGEGFGGEEAAANAIECSCGTCEACVDKAITEEITNEVAALVAVELSKKKPKSGRAGLLSMMMKHISGDRGEALVKAWETGDEEAIQQVLSGLSKKLASNKPEKKAE